MRQREVAGHPNAKEFGHTRICTVAAGEESLALYHAGTGHVWRWTPGAEGSAWTPELDSVPAGPVDASAVHTDRLLWTREVVDCVLAT
ncbi:hypothetical protein DIPPA_01367 [Diplonema papillatum]|nr:hypothetical protein DIPPA_01367 [Diplonema papillatum]